MKNKILFSTFALILASSLGSCIDFDESITVTITNGSAIQIFVDQSVQLQFEIEGVTSKTPVWSTLNTGIISVSSSGVVTGLSEGTDFVDLAVGRATDSIAIEVIHTPSTSTISSFSIDSSEYWLASGEIVQLRSQVVPSPFEAYVIYEIVSGVDFAQIDGRNLTAKNCGGEVEIIGRVGDVVSEPISVLVIAEDNDPYHGVSSSDFYATYTKSTSKIDTFFRTFHYFMSGSISTQNSAPTVSDFQPKEGELLIRNSSITYEDNDWQYNILDTNGDVVNTIFKFGAYVTLEEVAAYTLAFGDVPSNYTSLKTGNPSTDPWGAYLRLNNTYFSGNVSQYPYEPILPYISGVNDGNFMYYEIDIGTSNYNNGSRISRGTSRIVYTRLKVDGTEYRDLNERYVFYTYNHYNDFQEFLNYQNGWGEIFGNVTGGGVRDNPTDYYKTPYVPVVLKPFI